MAHPRFPACPSSLAERGGTSVVPEAGLLPLTQSPRWLDGRFPFTRQLWEVLVRSLTLVATLVASALFTSSVSAQSVRNIQGFVYDSDSGGPLEGVKITLTSMDFSREFENTTTDMIGRFSFSMRGPAEFSIVAQLGGYVAAPQSIRVSALPLEVTSLTIGMQATGGYQGEPGGLASTEVDNPTQDARTVRLHGKIIDSESGDGVESALVTEITTGREVLSRYDGRFDLGAVPSGARKISVERIGYATLEWSLEAGAGSDYEAHLPIHPEAIQIAGIQVTVRSRAVARRLEPVFQRMERSLGGYFLTATDFKRRGYQTVGATIQGMPSVQARQSGLRWIVRFRRGVTNFDAGCDPEVWVDGVRAAKSGADADDFFSINTSEIEIIEVYPSSISIPPEYSSSALCAIGIWTKRGG